MVNLNYLREARHVHHYNLGVAIQALHELNPKDDRLADIHSRMHPGPEVCDRPVLQSLAKEMMEVLKDYHPSTDGPRLNVVDYANLHYLIQSTATIK